MASRGLRDKPLIVSEYGVLMPSLYVCFCYDYAVGDAMVVNFPNRLFAGRGKKQPVDEVRYEDAKDTPFVMNG